MATDRPPDSPIRPDRWDEFTRDYAVVWDQLVFLRTSLYLLREVADFPLRVFLSTDDQWFLTVVGRSLYESVVLGVTKLVTDSQSDLLTLRGWRNRVRTMLLPERLAEYQAQLDETKLSHETANLADRAKTFRDGHIAHLRLDDVREGTKASLGIDDLDQLVRDTENLLRPLLFGASASFLPPVYDPDVRAANGSVPTDIERVLTHLASKSYALSEPETHPLTWSRRRAGMNDGQLAIFNKWRARTGKPPA